MHVYVCAGQLLLPVSLKTWHEGIGWMCVTALVAGFNGRCAGKERKEPRALLKISLISTEKLRKVRNVYYDEEGWMEADRGETWKRGKGLTGCHLWKKPNTLTIHMCSDESPAKEKKWMNAPTAADKAALHFVYCCVLLQNVYAVLSSFPGSLCPHACVNVQQCLWVWVCVWVWACKLNVFERWHKWHFASTPCGRSEPGGVTPGLWLSSPKG